MGPLRSLLHSTIRAKWAQFLAAAVTAATAATLFSGSSALQAVEAVTEDTRVAHLIAPASAHPDVVIVGLSEATLDQFPYRSPIDRAFLARLIERIAEQDPRVIGVDVMFDRASDPAGDRALLATIARHGDRIVLPAPTGDGAGLAQARQDFWRRFREAAISADGGLILSRRDRTVRTQIPADGEGAPQSFAAKIAAHAGARIPRGELAIPFQRSSDLSEPWPFRTYEAQHALSVPADLGWFRNKVVLIGALLDDEDRFATPLRLSRENADTIPGVVVHAYQVAQLLDGKEMRRAPAPLKIALTALMAAIGILLGAAIADWGWLTVAIAGAAFAHVLVAFALFMGSSVLWPIVAPVFALMFGGAGGAALSARQHATSRRALDQAFRHYLAPEIVDEIMRRPDAFKVAGEEREISVLVTDIEGFTAMLGEGETSVLAETLNEYFDALIDAVIAHGGAVDKIVGDGLFALFGAPVRQTDHAARAVRCALALDALGEDFRKRRADIGFGRTRIGVSTGKALVGSFGGARRINYTAYGPIVNLADRLQSANKAIGTRVLISAETQKQAGDIAARPVGRIALRGVADAELAYEPLSAATPDYLAAYAALETKEDKAHATFAALVRADADDTLSAFHHARLGRGLSGVDIDLRG